jgi:hypothetical protein
VPKHKKAWLAASSALVAAAIVAGGYYYFRADYTTSAELVALLPRSDALVAYVNIEMLRRAGILTRLDGSKALEDPEYRVFVKETGLDYKRDLDAVAIASVPDQLFAALLGRFDWKRLKQYAVRHGGSCDRSYCQVPGGASGRRVSFLPVRSNVMGLAISRDASAAYSLLPRRGTPSPAVPSYPVWLSLPKRLLENPDSLPSGGQIFARPLSAANQVTLGIGGESSSSGSPNLMLHLEAQCDSPQKAHQLEAQLTQATGFLKALTRQEQRNAPAGGLAQMLAGGTFTQAGNEARGRWPVPTVFLDSLLQ